MTEQQSLPGTDSALVAATYVSLDLARIAMRTQEARGDALNKEAVIAIYGEVFKSVRERQAVQYRGPIHRVSSEDDQE